MTTSDPVLYPHLHTQAETIRQDAARTRAELARTVEALAERLDVRKLAVRKVDSITRQAPPGWVAGAGAATVLLAARLIHRGPQETARRRRLATGVAAAVVGLTAYVTVARHRRVRPGTPTVAAAPAMPIAVGPMPPNPVGRDIVDVLLDQHRQIDGIFDWVRSTDGAARRDAFAALVELLHRHERAEQEIVHPVLGELDGSAAQVVADRRDEEGAADRSIASLISRTVDNPRFAADLDELHNLMRVHTAHEEAIEFPLLRARVSGDRLRSMANQVRAAQVEPW
jgi:hypothetical protein